MYGEILLYFSTGEEEEMTDLGREIFKSIFFFFQSNFLHLFLSMDFKTSLLVY